MTLQLVAPPPTSQEAECAKVVGPPLDYVSVAGLVDAIAGHAPARLPAQLAVIWQTPFKQEMRQVLDLAVACRDPLSELGAICIDALQTFADLDKLTGKQWHDLAATIGRPAPHASALLNACDYQISELTTRKQRPYKAIRTRLENAATAERKRCSPEIQALAGLRQALCPQIWDIYEEWRDTE